MLRCSHIVCKVDDLHAAVEDFTDLGFTVDWGSDPTPAENALVWFASGPFIEPLRPPAVAQLEAMAAAYGRALAQRLGRWARASEGWCDLALETGATELADAHAALQAAGVRTSPVIKGSRTRPDGQVVRYQLLSPGPATLPFVASAYDPPQRPRQVKHANGALEVTTVRLGVSAGDRPAYDALAPEDPWLRVEATGESRVISVAIRGLRDQLDPARLHGAVLSNT